MKYTQRMKRVHHKMYEMNFTKFEPQTMYQQQTVELLQDLDDGSH